MSKLQELINELCPDGVIFEELSKYVDYVQPQKYMVSSTNYSDEYNIPVLTPGQTFILGYTNDEDGIYDVELKGPIILFDDFTTSKKWVNFNFKVKSSALKILIPKNETINFRYLYHMMEEINFDKGEHGRKWISKYSKIKVPIPPLEIQDEIVKILDNFTNLTAELTAELTAREKQYEYYRSNLLKFNNDVEFVKIKEICKSITSGGTPLTSRSDYYDGNIPWLRTQEVGYGNIYTTGKTITDLGLNNSSAKWIPKNCVIIAMYGATVGRVGINKVELTTNQACCNLLVNKEEMNYKFVYYYLDSKYEVIKSLGQGAQTNINAQIVKNLEIPKPSLEEQKRIITILDKFSDLTKDINEGIPAEIEARKKQYEYYRNKLLTFKEL